MYGRFESNIFVLLSRESTRDNNNNDGDNNNFHHNNNKTVIFDNWELTGKFHQNYTNVSRNPNCVCQYCSNK